MKKYSDLFIQFLQRHRIKRNILFSNLSQILNLVHCRQISTFLNTDRKLSNIYISKTEMLITTIATKRTHNIVDFLTLNINHLKNGANMV